MKTQHPLPRRRVLAGMALALAGCGSSAPVQLYRLRAEPPAAPPPPQPASAGSVQLLPVRVPDYLDREAILLPQGGSGVLALGGHRWAESLRDAVPRVLHADLAALLGEGQVWQAPLPAGVTPALQLRVELLALEAEAERMGVRLHARWAWITPRGELPPRAQVTQLRVATQGGSVDALVDAHRLALWQLAARIAATR